jgi:hypothetical protein
VTVLYGTSSDPLAERAGRLGRELAREIGDKNSLGTFSTMLGLLLTAQRGRFEGGLTLVEEGLVEARRFGGELQVVSVSRALASNYLLDGRFAAAEEKIAWVVQELERLGHREQLSDMYVASFWMREGFSFYHDALDDSLLGVIESFELARKASNRTIQSTAGTVLSQIYLVRGDLARSKEWADRALATAEEIDNSSTIHRAAVICLASRVELGERAGLARFVELAEEGVPQGGNMLFAISILIETLCTLGDFARAERFARTSMEVAAGRLREMYALTALGEATLHLGPSYWAESQSAFEKATQIAQAIEARSTLAIAGIGLGELALLRGQNVAGREQLASALALSRQLGLRRYELRAERALGESPAAAATA